MTENERFDTLSIWRHGDLRCTVSSPVVRMSRERPYTYTDSAQYIDDLQKVMLINSREPALAKFNLGEEIELRLLMRLVEDSRAKGGWPISPTIVWHCWDAAYSLWVMTERP